MRITENGRITIPKKLRERFGLGEGAEVAMFPKPSTLFIRTWPPEDADPGIVEMLEAQLVWVHELPDERSNDGDPYGVRALVGSGKIAIPQCYRDRYGLHEEAEVELLPASNGILLLKCPAEPASTREIHEIPDGVLGALKGRDILGGLYASVDEYIRDIRGH